MIPTNLEHQQMLLEKIVGAYQSDGPLPALSDLHSCITRMDPKELAQAIYFLQYNECLNVFSGLPLYENENLNHRLFFSKGMKTNIEKIFMAVVEHFRRGPGQASQTVDQIFHYFYQTLVCLSTRQGLISYN